MTWGFLWLMVALKIPIAALLYLVWYATREPEPDLGPSDDGGTKLRGSSPHPRVPKPRGPRRGPHGEPPLPSPPRTRTRIARVRQLDH
jgi:hypothetical protein